MNIKSYINEHLTSIPLEKVQDFITLLEQENVIENQGVKSGDFYSGNFFLTEKGVHIIKSGGWKAYIKQLSENKRQKDYSEKLSKIKTYGEAMQYKFWWLTLGLGIISCFGTFYQLLTNDSPSRVEFNQLKEELNTLRKQIKDSTQSKTKSTEQNINAKNVKFKLTVRH